MDKNRTKTKSPRKQGLQVKDLLTGRAAGMSGFGKPSFPGADNYRLDPKLKCSFCGKPISRGSFNSKKDRLVCWTPGCGLYGQHQGYAGVEK